MSTTSNNRSAEHITLQNLFTKLASLFVPKFATLSQKFQLVTQKFRVIAVTSALSLLLGIMTFFPQSASAAAGLFSAKDTTPTLSVGMGGGGKSGGTAKRVGKFLVTIGAIGAGATTANVLRNKFTSCSDDNDDEEEEESSAASPHKNEPHKNEATKNESKTKGTTTNDDKSEIQPLSAEWIQQQLSDVERRSNVVNDAIKMTQQSSSSQPPPTAPPSASGGVNKSGGTSKIVTNGGSTTKTPTKKQLSVGNTIGIPNNTKNPLVKNLDSKIEMLQRRDAERTSQAQRLHDEQMKVKEEQKKVAIVEAERKIDLAEKEYKKKSQQVQQVVETKQEDVEEEESTITTTSSSSAATPPQPSKVFGPGGQPAKSKEEDLELTTQVILEYVKSMESSSGGGGGVDDSGDDE